MRTCRRKKYFGKPGNRTSSHISDLVRDVLGAVGVDEGVPRLVPVPVHGGDVGDHDGVAVAGERVLEQPGELGVSPVDELGLALGERVDAVAQGEERAVDVRALLQALALVLHKWFEY